MIGHLEESTNIVNSNRRLITAVAVNILFLILFVLFNGLIARSTYLIAGSVAAGVISTCTLFYQIILKL